MQSFSNPVTVPSIGEQQLVRLTDEQQLILNIRGYSSRGLQLFAHSWTAATTIMPVAQVVRLLLTTVGNTSTLDKLAWFLTVGSVLGQRWLDMAEYGAVSLSEIAEQTNTMQLSRLREAKMCLFPSQRLLENAHFK